ncbi:choice-of-anchor Q domain-containing protein [Dokdonella sp.]|uniref:choice-of-anchor Q domain-containing protein n=1 Tax=Dokdonella sp. TaxID=2291710 RepID=UPI0037839508
MHRTIIVSGRASLIPWVALAAPCSALAQQIFDCVAPSSPPLIAPVVLGNGNAGSVTTAQLQQALDAGGSIRLNIGASTLVVNPTLTVTRASVLDLAGGTLSGGNARRVIEVQNPSNLSYTFAMKNGSVTSGSTPSGSGAGLFKATGGPWQAVTIQLFDLHFSNNHAIASAQDDGGGALYVVGAAELAIVRSDFIGNSGSNGGALYSLGSQRVNLYDSTFTGNTATGSGGNPGNGGNGGAIGVDGDARFVNLCRVRLVSNVANAYGGGLYTVTYSGASFTRLQDSTMQGNASSASDKLAGGAYIQGSPIAISGSTFRDNSASGYAGLALFGAGGVLQGSIINSTFVGNVANNGLGGAMSISGATALTLQNLTIAHNRAPCGVCFAGGIANDSGAALTLRNALFEDNTGGNAFNPWAMLHAAANGAGNLQWPQTRPGSGGQQESAVAPGTLFANANLADPATNGGLTETMALPPGSPGIDAGAASGAPAHDQRGASRFGAVDIGAYEWQGDLIFRNGFDQGT